MHPVLSVIFFTVASGAGYGLFILLTITHIFGLTTTSPSTLLVGGILSLLLITAGLISSVGHLANPKNAWRAFFRFKTSWLSREGVFAVAFYPFAALYLLIAWKADGRVSAFVSGIGLVACLIALATVFSTGMIYACLKTIRQWNTALTPANYLLLGLASGAVLMTMVLMITGHAAAPIARIAVVLLLMAGMSKAIYYFWIRKQTGPTINTATGFTRAKVRLLDTGHTAGTFLTNEFGYRAQANVRVLLKAAVFGLGILLPIMALIAIISGSSNSFVAFLAVLSTLLGIGAERWLFFAEARQVVNLYHGAQQT